MRPLKLVFTKSLKKFPILSWAIMKWTKKPYSHVAREVIRRDWGAGYYQASEGNVNYEHENIFFKKHKIVKEYVMQIPTELEMSIRKACWEECGNSYGMLQNIGIMLIDILAYFGVNIGNPWKKGRNCSELMYLKVLKPMFPELNYNHDTIKPHEIEDILISKGYIEIIE